jgi:transketolase
VADSLSDSSIKVGVIDLFNITNFDKESLALSLNNYKGLVTMEEGFRGRGGLDSMMFEFIARQRLNLPLLNLGVESCYRFALGAREELHEQVGIGPKYVKESIAKFIQTLVTR